MLQVNNLVTNSPRCASVGKMAAIARISLWLIAAFFGMTSPLLAQTADLSMMLDSSLGVTGKGWAQITDLSEIGEFVLGIVEATAMTALIAYHPSSIAARRSVADFQMPRNLFAYSLIGMVVGFLVVNHGYVIGFVIFGLGGLLRFRNSVENSLDTAKFILVTLLGLCVGINLPVVALFIAVNAWLIMFIMGKGAFLTLDVKFSDKIPISESIRLLQEDLEKSGFKPVSVTKSKFNPTVEFVLAGDTHASREILMAEMNSMETSGNKKFIDWHLD